MDTQATAHDRASLLILRNDHRFGEQWLWSAGRLMALAETMVRVNVPTIESTKVPPLAWVRSTIVIDETEERWSDAGSVARRRRGRLIDLACWRAAELRIGGRDAAVDFEVVGNGILVPLVVVDGEVLERASELAGKEIGT